MTIRRRSRRVARTTPAAACLGGGAGRAGRRRRRASRRSAGRSACGPRSTLPSLRRPRTGRAAETGAKNRGEFFTIGRKSGRIGPRSASPPPSPPDPAAREDARAALTPAFGRRARNSGLDEERRERLGAARKPPPGHRLRGGGCRTLASAATITRMRAEVRSTARVVRLKVKGTVHGQGAKNVSQHQCLGNMSSHGQPFPQGFFCGLAKKIVSRSPSGEFRLAAQHASAEGGHMSAAEASSLSREGANP